MESTLSEFDGAISVLERCCQQANLAFLPEGIGEAEPNRVYVTLGKAVLYQGTMISRSTSLCLSRKFLLELPNTLPFQEQLQGYLTALSSRMENPREFDYLTLNGIPIEVEVDWPLVRSPDGRDATFVRVGTTVRTPEEKEANFAVFVSGTVECMAFPSLVPIFTEHVVINAVRRAIDTGLARFHESGEHPLELQPIPLTTAEFEDKAKGFAFHKASDQQVHDYIERKVYWLGFRSGGRESGVWIADPFDATYLGTTPLRMKQIAEVLAAKKIITLDPRTAFARASDRLLEQSDQLELDLQVQLFGGPRVSPMAGRTENARQPSAFISYSSQDREFCERLAMDLKRQDLGVWFDKWEIRVGDSLTKRIGEGIRTNDYLIVVLSPHSVDSEWVKKELGEAMQREIKERRVVVLPIMIRTCELPAFLTDKRYADFRQHYDEGFRELVRGIKR